jgi:hypothetical protein
MRTSPEPAAAEAPLEIETEPLAPVDAAPESSDTAPEDAASAEATATAPLAPSAPAPDVI